MKLFEYAVIYVPNEKSVKEGQVAQVIVQPTCTVAKDQSSVQLMAAKKIPDEYDNNLDEVQVVVRPF